MIYSAKIAAALLTSRALADTRERDAIRTAVKCSWCGQPIVNNAPCCGAEPWRTQ